MLNQTFYILQRVKLIPKQYPLILFLPKEDWKSLVTHQLEIFKRELKITDFFNLSKLDRHLMNFLRLTVSSTSIKILQNLDIIIFQHFIAMHVIIIDWTNNLENILKWSTKRFSAFWPDKALSFVSNGWWSSSDL